MIRSSRRRLMRYVRTIFGALTMQVMLAWPALGETVLTFATVDEDAKEEAEEYALFAQYMRRQLAPVGIDEVRVVVHTSIGNVARAMSASEVDLYIDSPVLATLVARGVGAKPFLRLWKEGVAAYHTVFYATRESGITSLEDLRGKVLAFKASESTPGHFVPRAHLVAAGLRLVELETPDQPVPPDAIGYVYSDGDRTALAWVMKGVVDAAVVKQSFVEDGPATGLLPQLVIFERTRDVPRQVLVRRADMAPPLLEQIERVMTSMHENEAGRAALTAMHETARIDHFPEGERGLESIRRMIDLLEAESGTKAMLLVN